MTSRAGPIAGFPAAQARMAASNSSAGALLLTYPTAPACCIAAVCSAAPNMDSPITFTSGHSARICRVASIPFMPGMLMSMSTTSGCNSFVRSTPALPSAASPTTSRSGSARSIWARAWRTTA